jgi:hypothetical protein
MVGSSCDVMFFKKVTPNIASFSENLVFVFLLSFCPVFVTRHGLVLSALILDSLLYWCVV